MESQVAAMVQEAIAEPDTEKPLTAPRGSTPVLDKKAFSTMNAAIIAIESQLDTEKTSNQDDWDLAVKLVGDCNDIRNDHFDAEGTGVEALFTASEQLLSNHNTCRGQEDTDRNDEYNKHQTMVEKNGVMVTKTSNADGAKPPCHTGERTPAQMLGDLREAKSWAEGHTLQVKNSIDAYNGAKSAHTGAQNKANQKASGCDADQQTFEAKFCQFKDKIDTSCSDHKKCIDRTTKARDEVEAKLKDKIKAEKVILKSCSKVRCYLNLLTMGQSITQGDYGKCNQGQGTMDSSGAWDKTGDTVLNIKWTEKIDGVVCDTSRATIAPGDASFADRYTNPTLQWMPDLTGIEQPVLTCNNQVTIQPVDDVVTGR